ncbi:MAG: adenylate/guanylate cyclase domain-containing protein [Gallionella sp.]
MEERGNKTIMCSVFFLDIVEYSKKSVAGQISLKDRFNSYLSSAIRDVPMTDRIILDTGDGAAINFLGDVEDALKAALSLRESLLAEDPNVDPPLLVRMGINLGPVRLVRDINGQPNIVGDGINVAQRVMGFADAAQILVSRSYYDAVSRLSPQYAGMFHYQGSRTDKHVREHEVYAIGYPGDITSHRGGAKPLSADQADNLLAGLTWRVQMLWRSAAAKLDALIEFSITRYQQAGLIQRAMYIAGIGIAFLLLITLLVSLSRRVEGPVAPTAKEGHELSVMQPSSAVAPVVSVQKGAEAKSPGAAVPHVQHRPKPKAKKIAREKSPAAKPPEKRQFTKSQDATVKNAVTPPAAVSSDGKDAYILVICKEGTEVFIDGARKGRIGTKPLAIAVPPGQHTVIVSHTSGGIYTQNVELVSGKTVHIKPNFCD